MIADKTTYYIVHAPDKKQTGVLRIGKELATIHEVEAYFDYTEYKNRCVELDIEPAEELTYDFSGEKGYISVAQGRSQLRRLGLLGAVETYMKNQADGEEQDFWEYGTRFYRYSPTIEKLGHMLQIDLDEFFAAAKQIHL
jgi:hypothetical protein